MKGSKLARVATVAFAVVALGAPAAVFAESWKNASLVDVKCSTRVKADPDAHTRDCAIQCAGSGYGIWTSNGEYLKFDAEGSKQALALLKATDRKDHLRVDVTGELADGTLTVASIVLATAN